MKIFVKNFAKNFVKDFESSKQQVAMQDDDDKGERRGSAFAISGKSAKQDQRQDRLKLALRENLKRRKSQARGRGDPAAPSNTDAPSPYDDGASKQDE